jgi:hypothetical protein
LRKKCSFLLTILPSEDRQSNLQGRLEVIATGKVARFTNLLELQALLEEEINHLVVESSLPPASNSPANQII